MFSRTLFKASTSTISRAIQTPLRLSFRYQSSLSNKLNPSSLPSTYSKGPITLRFTEDHEWVAVHPDNTAFIGITPYAADAIGDVTYVELPEVGDKVQASNLIGSIESVKSSNDIYSPLDGEIIEVNENLNDNAPLVNQDPLGEGWIVKIKVDEDASLEALKDEEGYEADLKAE